MKKQSADKFFQDINFISIVDNIKGIFTSDGSMSTLLDFERVLDEADLYAFENWISGELVNGPVNKRYSVECTFMYPHKLMPNPLGVKRLLILGCNVEFEKGKIQIPVQVKDYEDFQQGTRYPKMETKKVWFVTIEIPKELMNEIKEGSIDLADKSIDLEDIDNAYEEDLDKENLSDQDQQQAGAPEGMGAPMGAPMAGPGPAPLPPI
jgi:hypothetical protein